MATQVSAIECRSSKRVALQCSIIVATGVQTSEGRVLNVSNSGCLVEAPILIKAGDYLQMRLFLPNTDLSMCVCRWRSSSGPSVSGSGSSLLKWTRSIAHA
jgi:hypothetical protein